MSDPTREYENEAVRKTLVSSYCPDSIREARERQDAFLVDRFEGREIKIADIGCGDGYHGAIFAPSCLLYHGFEISPAIAELARKRWREKDLDNAEVFLGDVATAELEKDFYDLVLCLYFTPGNFRDRFEDVARYTDAYLDQNPAFARVVSRFYRAMKLGASMLLTVYKDVSEAAEAQIDFYENTGQHVISPRELRFVATEEGFWSVRWTKKSVLSNLAACGVDEEQVVFRDLNRIAWLVEIRK